MEKITSYRDLKVWQKSMDLVKEVYDLIKKFPKVKMYSLSDQVRRCIVSIPSNIAEGYGRNYKADYCRFLQISRGSLFELQTQLEIDARLNYLKSEDLDKPYKTCIEIEKMLNSLISKLPHE